MGDTARRRIPEATVARLPLYYRALLEAAEQEVATISSERLAELAGVNAAKVRKDLSYLGSYGTRGVGYDVDYLLHEISRELGLTRDWPVAIVGIGNLGRALANYRGFGARGFRIVALVDADQDLVGDEVGELTIEPIADLARIVEDRKITIGMIATPAPVAQEVADKLVDAGVRSILNFAPAVLAVPNGVSIRKVDLATELQILSFYQLRRGSRPIASRPRRPGERAREHEPRTALSERGPSGPAAQPPRAGNVMTEPATTGTASGRSGLMGQPVNLLVRGRRVVVVGAGRIAARKIEPLLDLGANVVVVAPVAVPEIRAWVDAGRCELIEREFRADDLSDAWLAITATDVPAVNQAVFEAGEAARVWTNSADDPANCAFTMMSVIRRADLVVAVGTGGRSPALATYLRRMLTEELGPEYETLLELLSEAREAMRSSGRSSEDADWQRAFDSGIVDLVRAGRVADTKELLNQCL